MSCSTRKPVKSGFVFTMHRHPRQKKVWLQKRLSDFFSRFFLHEKRSPLKKKTSVLDSVSCGDETPTAMHDRTRLRKLFGTIQSRDLFPVDVSRPPRWKKVTTFFSRREKIFFHITEASPFKKTAESFVFSPFLPYRLTSYHYFWWPNCDYTLWLRRISSRCYLVHLTFFLTCNFLQNSII